MQSNDSLRELNTKLLAEIAELRKKFAEIKGENGELKNENAKLRQIIENSRRDAENTEQKARIEELERNSANISAENTELKARVAKLEQDSKQPQNDSHFEEAVIIPESVAVKLSGANGAVPEVIMVPANSKSSEEKEMDKFLDEAVVME
ncbi:hypothetical protein C1645_730983 [Glomus cerebriforme]|uniref:Uncharacterized protein n=1 Tax=Glomus cerebriforme TaxID=658196 RepID=A0A397TPL0_9GLOM|nr:hypothetical protein C1645_730983 [Glomus cerebriforme]